MSQMANDVRRKIVVEKERRGSPIPKMAAISERLLSNPHSDGGDSNDEGR